MCVIAASPKNVVIPKENLEQCYKSNSDGAGFMVAKNNSLIVKKGFFSFDEFYDAYAPYEKDKVVCHFRIKTHGERNAENCHPFPVAENMAFVHNGVIRIKEENKNFSDTWHFNEKIIKPMYRDNQAFIRKLYNQELIKEFIGYSKLVFLDNKGRGVIINEDKGTWKDGVWYSNTSYKVVKWLSSTKAGSKFYEGDVVEFNRKWGMWEEGDWAYVDNVLPNGMLQVVIHEWSNGKTVEFKATVHPSCVREMAGAYV
jgi:glutamine amidotransferase